MIVFSLTHSIHSWGLACVHLCSLTDFRHCGRLRLPPLRSRSAWFPVAVAPCSQGHVQGLCRIAGQMPCSCTPLQVMPRLPSTCSQARLPPPLGEYPLLRVLADAGHSLSDVPIFASLVNVDAVSLHWHPPGNSSRLSTFSCACSPFECPRF